MCLLLTVVLVYRPHYNVAPNELSRRWPSTFMTSLWASVHDPNGNTTALYFMRDVREGYIARTPAVRLLAQNRPRCPVHISFGNVLRQLASTNQPSHNWLKAPAAVFYQVAGSVSNAKSCIDDPKHLWHYLAIGEDRDHEFSAMQAEFIEYYKNRVIIAKRLIVDRDQN